MLSKSLLDFVVDRLVVLRNELAIRAQVLIELLCYYVLNGVKDVVHT